MMQNQLLGFLLFIAFLGFAACTEEPEPTMSAVDTQASAGGYIEKDSANKMIGSYLASLPEQDSTAPDLHALILNADVIRDYLGDTAIHSLKLMFAHSLDYINAGNEGVPAGYKSGAFTMIMLGFNSAGDYVYAPGKQAFNRWVPCPLNCPEEGDAASDYLN